MQSCRKFKRGDTIREIYLDYNATTPVDPGVVEAMLPYLKKYFHNPSSLYNGSIKVRSDIESAREKIATLINSGPEELFSLEVAVKPIIWQ